MAAKRRLHCASSELGQMAWLYLPRITIASLWWASWTARDDISVNLRIRWLPNRQIWSTRRFLGKEYCSLCVRAREDQVIVDRAQQRWIRCLTPASSIEE